MIKDKRFLQQRSTRDGVLLLSFPFVRLGQQVQLVYLKAHTQLEQKTAQILMYDKSHQETITRYYHTT